MVLRKFLGMLVRRKLEDKLVEKFSETSIIRGAAKITVFFYLGGKQERLKTFLHFLVNS